jgi:hypothetical protein
VTATLVGHWRRRAGSPACAAAYAARLEFQPGGLYAGSTEPPGEFTWWDSGTWQLRGPGRVALSTANDAVVEYGYVLKDKQLDFTDAAGCSFGYDRVT